MKSPRVTGPLFSETAKGSIKEFGTFRNIGGRVFIEQKRKGPKIPPAASAEMRQLFSEAWEDYLALPLTKPRTGKGAPVYRQPAWGQFWRQWWAIYQLGGVFTGGASKNLPYVYLTARGKIARTGDALLMIEAPTLASAGGFEAGEVAIISASVGSMELECTDDPYFIPRVNRAKIKREIESITATASVETRQLAMMRAGLDAIGIECFVNNPYADAYVIVQLEGATCVASAETG